MAESWADVGTTVEAALTTGALVICFVWLAAGSGRRIGAVLSARRPPLLPALPLLGLALSLPATASPSAASERRLRLPRREALASPPPWNGPGAVSSSLPVRAEERMPDSAPWREPSDLNEADEGGPSSHPAIHGGRSATVVRLFPREGRRSTASARHESARADAMRRHPAGKGRRIRGVSAGAATAATSDQPTDAATARYRVREGDTLWDVAAGHLQTDDLRRIARYWPSIHRANRSLIGPNPNLIQPGWVLVLPPESAL